MAHPVGVLALQGAFREHIRMLGRLGCPAKEARQLKDLDGISALIIPGGESTAIGKLLVDLGMMEPLRNKIAAGMPVFGTCAGLILLCEDIEDSSQPRIGLLRAKVRRNAFGRQVDSFEADIPMPAIGPEPYHAVFIRAPVILQTSAPALAMVEQGGEERVAAVRQDNILATSFHPELTGDTRVHRYFLDMIK